VPKVLSVTTLLTLLTHVCRNFDTEKTGKSQNSRLDQYTGDKQAIDKMASLLGHDRNEQLVLLWTACGTKMTHTDIQLSFLWTTT
jgi:hypothetical protein